MIINKYSSPKEKSATVIGSYADRGSSSSSSSSASTLLDRTLWGQQDNGDDIDGDINVNGNIFCGNVPYASEDDDEDIDETPEDPTHDFPSDSGNLFAEKSVVSPEVYGHSLYLNYEENKVNILDLLKTLKEELLALIESQNPFGSPIQPVILAAGQAVRINGSNWRWEGGLSQCFSSATVLVRGGQMRISFVKRSGFSNPVIFASTVTQAESSDTADLSQSLIENDLGGAHWFESRWNTSDMGLYIREFHKDARGNQTWSSIDWISEDCATRINVVLIGYVIKNS